MRVKASRVKDGKYLQNAGKQKRFEVSSDADNTEPGISGLCGTKPLCKVLQPKVAGEFPAQMASNAKNVPFDDVIMEFRFSSSVKGSM